MNTRSLSRLLAAGALPLLLASCCGIPSSPSPEPDMSAPSAAASAVAAPVADEAAKHYDLETRCRDSYLLLVDKTYEEMGAGAYCDTCGAFDDLACELDWPSSDLPPCSELDVARNTIYAYYGRPFTSDVWKRYFSEKPWYESDPTYTDARLSETARANVTGLVARKSACMKQFCTPPAPDGGEYLCVPFGEAG